MKSTILAVVFILVLCASISSAQQAQNPPLGTYTFDCTTLSYFSAGCSSYNEMIKAADKDLLANFGYQNHAFVCFRPNEDVFFVFSFDIPTASLFKPSKLSRYVLEATGIVNYERFENGVEQDINSVIGRWTKGTDSSIPIYFSTDPNAQGQIASVNDAELSYQEKFTNLSNTQTTYNVQIRRSTLRFDETYTFPNPQDHKTSTAPATSQDRTDSNGHCAEFISD